MLLRSYGAIAIADGPVAFNGAFFSGVSLSENGTRFLELADKARRMFAPGDAELPTLSGVYDPVNNAVVEGVQWAGNQWTQNSYGLGVTATPFLQEPHLTWLQTSYLWWFDHMGDGTQAAAGTWAPDGMM